MLANDIPMTLDVRLSSSGGIVAVGESADVASRIVVIFQQDQTLIRVSLPIGMAEELWIDLGHYIQDIRERDRGLDNAK